ncbi:low molecular weight phosphotyrosine protein phosphatase [Paraburkholderia sp.]|uniref:arsenate reductase/protein-tyrosine-phosphatase family protein n=1 Tax=Paraburkholderia sp. TaxID=1926495 RepID=UPI0023892966|nr:low molecular weight phosphotyrosine protein phosphatase [Paraburkholderia sp.]MDE1184325.1 low molecular weight phosphotyrosine protein phosphatase [Paraburkholderia sp.]
MFANVLIVCHANVCRSPVAEMLFKAHQRARLALPIMFHSAGIRAREGFGMDPVMRGLLAERGVPAGVHYSRRLDRELVRGADLVLVTERRQVQAVEALDPVARGKVYPLGQWEDSDVVDPHGSTDRAYRESFALIEHLVTGWMKKIC